MKITFDIDCTPKEARAFLGLPDVAPMQARLLEELEARMKANLGALDPEALLKRWLPGGLEGLEQLQRAFWSRMGGAGPKP